MLLTEPRDVVVAFIPFVVYFRWEGPLGGLIGVPAEVAIYVCVCVHVRGCGCVW